MKRLLSVFLCAAMLFVAVPFVASAKSDIESIAEFGCDVADIICLQSSGEAASSRLWLPDFYLLLDDGTRIDVELSWNEQGQYEEYFVLDGKEYYVETVDSPYPLSYNYYMLDPGTYTYTAKLDCGEKVFTCEYKFIIRENFVKSVEMKPISVCAEEDYVTKFYTGSDGKEYGYDDCEWYKYIDAVIVTADGKEIHVDGENRNFEYGGTTYRLWVTAKAHSPEEEVGRFVTERYSIAPLEDSGDVYFYGDKEVYVSGMHRITGIEFPEENYFEDECYLCGYGEYDEETEDWTNHYKYYGDDYLTVHLSDGTVREAYVDEISAWGTGGRKYLVLYVDNDLCVFDCDNLQGPDNEWGAGQNIAHYTVFGNTYTRTVNVIGIESVDIPSVKYYEYENGYYDYRDYLDFTVTLTNGDKLYSNDENNYYDTLVYGDRYIHY
ncbi:MAG: hypothetical protein J5760_04500, partial [Clostridia bacterium]|nr:hypothetical protein [Clostridia bacterium]